MGEYIYLGTVLVVHMYKLCTGNTVCKELMCFLTGFYASALTAESFS